jgi:hypothetical protein
MEYLPLSVIECTRFINHMETEISTDEPLFRKHISFKLLKNCKGMHHHILMIFRQQ